MTRLSIAVCCGIVLSVNGHAAEPLQECARIPDAASRLQCFEALARESAASSSVTAATVSAAPVVAESEASANAGGLQIRWFVKTNIDPVKPDDFARLKDLPATLSVSRRDGRHFVDARAAVLGQFVFGEFENNTGFIGLQWTRAETSDKRTDTRTLGFGLQHIVQSSGPLWATLEPRISYTKDIAKDEDTWAFGLATDFGHFGFSEGETVEESNPRKVPFFFTLGFTQRNIDATMGPDRDFTLAQLATNIGWKPHPKLYFRARPGILHYFDAPAAFAEDHRFFGIAAAEWDLSSGSAAKWKPSLVLSRSFGKNSSDPEFTPNLTKLSFAVRFDSGAP